MQMAHTTRRGLLAAALTLTIIALAACAGPPDKAIADAEKALREATVVSECAEAEFAEAEEMLAQAKRLVESGDYEEAEVKAKAAKALAERAQKAGEDSWDDCQEEKRRLAEANNPKELDDIDVIFKDGKLSTIYFDYDEATLSADAQKALQNNAEWLRRNPNAKLSIQGHCDERGTTEYNLALGERRAVTARKYLVQLGIKDSRLSILSYGGEMPAIQGNTEDSFARNRRAEFVVKQ